MANTVTGGRSVEIIIELKNGRYPDSEIMMFLYNNKINTPPTGEFVIINRNNIQDVPASGDQGTIFFRNTEDGNTAKSSALNIVLNVVERIKTGVESAYKISWKCGVTQSLNLQSFAVEGDSIKAMIEGAKKYGYDKFKDRFSDTATDKPLDNMVWRYINNSLWDTLDETVNYSYLKDDYIFWTFDDVNSNFNVSSLKLENSLSTSNIFMYNQNNNTGLDEVRKVYKEPNLTLWSYATETRDNTLGANRDKLFPAVVFSGIADGDISQAECSDDCFSSVLTAGGDNSQQKIKDSMGITGPQKYSKEEVKVIRNYPNNTHKMYSLASTFRNYKLATYAKTVKLVMKSTIGPPLGSCCAIVCFDNGVRNNATPTFDKIFTDEYILLEKSLSFKTFDADKMGDTTSKSTNEVITTLRFVSKNLGSEGFDAVTKLLKSLEEAKK